MTIDQIINNNKQAVQTTKEAIAKYAGIRDTHKTNVELIDSVLELLERVDNAIPTILDVNTNPFMRNRKTEVYYMKKAQNSINKLRDSLTV